MEDVNASFELFAGCVPASALVQMSSYVPPSRLVVLQHKAHAEEIVTKNGEQKDVHIIVKNTPYQLRVGSAFGAPRVDFNKIVFEAFLLYDSDGLKEEVDYVKNKPVEFRCSPTDHGEILDVELRIKVLSSQHQDSLFKVKIQGYNPSTREELPSLVAFTPSLKVISKPEQLKHKQLQQTSYHNNNSTQQNNTTASTTPPNTKKRNSNELMASTISRIEQKQHEQQRLIQRILQQQSEHAQHLQKRQKLEEAHIWEVVEQKQNSEKKVKTFEDAFVNLIKAFSGMIADEKPETIRRVVRNTSSRDTEKLSEFLEFAYTERQNEPLLAASTRKNRDSVFSIIKEEGCSCYDCPHKQELERIDEFYKEFLSTGLSMPIMANGY